MNLKSFTENKKQSITKQPLRDIKAIKQTSNETKVNKCTLSNSAKAIFKQANFISFIVMCFQLESRKKEEEYRNKTNCSCYPAKIHNTTNSNAKKWHIKLENFIYVHKNMFILFHSLFLVVWKVSKIYAQKILKTRENERHCTTFIS